MRRWAATAIATAATVTLIVAGAGASAGGGSGLKGVLLDTTCPGPCYPCPPCTTNVCPARTARIACPAPRTCTGCATSQPYTGPDAHVAVRRLPSKQLVARKAPAEGRFSFRLPPGSYRVHGYVAERCWQGETQRVSVRGGSFTRVQLAVHNDCIRRPQRR